MKEKGSKLYKSVLPNFFNRDKSTESTESTSSPQPVVPLRFQSTNNNQQEVIDPVARFQQSNNIDQQQFMSYSRMPARMTISTEEYKNLKQRTAFMDDAGKKTGEVECWYFLCFKIFCWKKRFDRTNFHKKFNVLDAMKLILITFYSTTLFKVYNFI